MARDSYPPVHYGLVSYPPWIAPSFRQYSDQMAIPFLVHVVEFICGHWKVILSISKYINRVQ